MKTGNYTALRSAARMLSAAAETAETVGKSSDDRLTAGQRSELAAIGKEAGKLKQRVDAVMGR